MEKTLKGGRKMLNRKCKWKLFSGVALLICFALWTVAVCFCDLQSIGPRNSVVGLSTINKFVHEIIGENMLLYVITDWLGILPLCFILGFAILGLTQWIKRKKLLKVDYSILSLGVFYVVVLAVYILFEFVVVNYRPVLIEGYLEASYPSSTTMLVLCVMPTAIMQFNARIKGKGVKIALNSIISAFIVFMVVGRLMSGVHWFSDIIGGILLSVGLVQLYSFSLFLQRYRI